MGKNLIVPILTLFLLASVTYADDSTSKAKELFDRYISLEKAFDPALADVYADDAKIQTVRISPAGEKRATTVSAKDYKRLIKEKMPVVKARGRTDNYSDIQYIVEGERVRINCMRLSSPGVNFTPFSLLVGPGKDGPWLIFEETSQL